MTKLNDTKLLSYTENPVWISFPVTIIWMQNQRNKFNSLHDFEKIRGINITIILLSAACVEGFLVECLMTYVIGNRFVSSETDEGKAKQDLYKRISQATFGDFRELFREILGKTISECINEPSLIEGILALIDFRNGVAHARSVVYEKFGNMFKNTETNKVGNQYKTVHDYLEKNKLICTQGDLFVSDISDHFSNLIKPYIIKVLSLLPSPQSDNVKTLVDIAFKEQP